MPSLSSDEVLEVRSEIMSVYSSIRQEIPISKNQLTALITLMDSELNTAEIAIIVAIPAGAARDWLMTEDAIGRDIITRTETKRRDVL